MPTKVFLAVEGRNDGGALGKAIRARANDRADEGALQPLVRRLASGDVELWGQKVTMLSLRGVTEPEEAIGRRARLASGLAQFNGCELLVFHQDVDGPATGVPDDRTSAWQTVERAVREGAEVAEREGEGLAATACVAAAPLRTIESWLLGDAAAVSTVAEPGSADESAALADPEGLWDRQDAPASRHPKIVLQRAVGGPRAKVSTSHYRRLAEQASIAELRRTCPVSFEPFAETCGRLLDA